jgi:hypothetical protein
MTEEEMIKQRIPVWSALIDLLIYPDMAESDKVLENVIDICIASKYSSLLLEKIYYDEVIPTIYTLFNDRAATANTKSTSDVTNEKILALIHNKLPTEISLAGFIEKCKSIKKIQRKWSLLQSLLKCSLQINNSNNFTNNPSNILRQRMRVWQAISSVYLYSDIIDSPLLFAEVLEGCRQSGYSLSLLDKIYAYEVIPALDKGLGGWGWEADNHWMGFDPDFLMEKILKYTNGDLITQTSQLSFRQKISSYLRTRATDKNWRNVKSLI